MHLKIRRSLSSHILKDAAPEVDMSLLTHSLASLVGSVELFKDKHRRELLQLREAHE